MARPKMHGGFISNLGMGWSLVIVMTTLILTIVIIILIVGATKGWFNKSSTPGSSSGSSSSSSVPTNVLPNSDIFMAVTPYGCDGKIGCVNQSFNVAVTVRPQDIKAPKIGTINWSITAYSSPQGGSALARNGSVPITELGNTTKFPITVGNVEINRAQIKVIVTLNGKTSSPQYYNYST